MWQKKSIRATCSAQIDNLPGIRTVGMITGRCKSFYGATRDYSCNCFSLYVVNQCEEICCLIYSFLFGCIESNFYVQSTEG